MEYKYIEEIFKRTDLQQFRNFLIYGMDMNITECDNKTYTERLNQGRKNIVKRLEKIAKNDEELDEIFSDYSDSEVAHRDVFLEIGMKAGAIFIFQLLYQDNYTHD